LFVPCAANWSEWIPDSAAQQTLQNGGYYTVLADKGRRVIALETTWYDTRNHFIVNKTDVAGQDTWLNKTLAMARANNESVWMLGHIYPGSTRTEDTLNYQAVLNEYQDIIKANLYGHSHKDQFTISHPNHAAGTPPNNATTGVVYVTPALMPDDQDPSFRVYEYDTETFEISDILQFHASLPKINSEQKITFELTYSARDEYQLKDLSPASWWDLTVRMESNDTLFQTWMGHHLQGTYDGSCTGSCEKNTICSLRYAFQDDKSACFQ